MSLQMLAVQVGALLILLTVDVFAPGFFWVRRLRWSPLEKLCGAIGLSLILLYLASAVFYWLGPAHWAGTSLAASGVCLALAILTAGDIRKLAASKTVRHAVSGFVFLLLFTLAILTLIRNYSGGGWGNDWLEHFQRTLFFLHGFPKNTPILGNYALPARPPMMNLLGAFFLAQTGDRFALFQVAFAFLNLLVFLPCCLIAPALALRGRRRMAPLAGIFALSPLIIQNATYTWTKLLAAFYVILALWFYIRGWRKRDSKRMTAAFVFLAAGALVHYSAAPYAVFLGLHYLLVVFRGKERPPGGKWPDGKPPDGRWRELAAIAGLSALLLATWFAWSIRAYGTRVTFTSNTSLTPSQKVEGSNLAKIASNFLDTIVPHPLRSDAPARTLKQPNAVGEFRDYTFLIYQTNVIFGMGAIGGPVVLYLVYQMLWKKRDLRWRPRRSQQSFWVAFLAFCLVLGIAVHGERDTFGVAHVTLQPLMVLGLAILAGSFGALPRVVAFLVVAGCAVDFGVGALPQAFAENLENSLHQTVFGGLSTQGGRLALGQPERDSLVSLSRAAWTNWFLKHQFEACGEWLRELSHFAPGNPAAASAAETMKASFEECRQNDQSYWHGWFARNGGVAAFLGDSTAGGPWNALAWTTVAVMFLALIARMVRAAMVRVASKHVGAKSKTPPIRRRR